MVEHVRRPDVDVLSAVPPDPVRRLLRGEHPAVSLAAELSRSWEIPELQVLDRVGTRPRQRDLPLAERRRNVQGAFACRAARSSADGGPPKRVLLVDDVYTTGATVAAAAGALRRAGTTRVEVVTFARTVR